MAVEGAIEIGPEAIVLDYIRRLVPDLETKITAASAFNQLPSIPWNWREAMRMIEGKLDGIVIDCIDIVGRLGTEEAEAYLEQQWPDP